MVTRDEAIAELSQLLSERLSSIGVEALGSPNAALSSTPDALARLAVEWFESLGVEFPDPPNAEI